MSETPMWSFDLSPKFPFETAVSLLVSEGGKGRAQEWAPPVSKFVLRIHRPRACCVLPHLAGSTGYHHTSIWGVQGCFTGCVGVWSLHERQCTLECALTLCSCDLEHQTLWEKDHSQKRDALTLSMVEPDLNSHPVANPCIVFNYTMCLLESLRYFKFGFD